jgi:hypothetical protein
MLPWETCEGCREFYMFWHSEYGHSEMPWEFKRWIKYCDGHETGYTQEWTKRHMRSTHPEIYTMFLLMNEED